MAELHRLHANIYNARNITDDLLAEVADEVLVQSLM